MSDENLTPSARMSAAFAKLRDSASEIKTISDELIRSVRGIEQALNRLELRVASYALLSEWKATDQDEYRREYVGYIELHRQWRIVVRTAEGYESRPDEEREVIWLLDEAPQYLRIKAVDKLPDLIEALVATVERTASRLKKRIQPTQELEKAVASLGNRIIKVKLPKKVTQ